MVDQFEQSVSTVRERYGNDCLLSETAYSIGKLAGQVRTALQRVEGEGCLPDSMAGAVVAANIVLENAEAELSEIAFPANESQVEPADNVVDILRYIERDLVSAFEGL
jgi:hypothetical protein